MSRLMGFIHDRVIAAGHDVDYLCADDVPASWGGGLGRRLKFPLAVYARVARAAREGCPYDIVNVHEPSAAPIVIGGRGIGTVVVVTSHGLERRAWELAKEERRLGREAPAWRTRVTYPMSTLWPVDASLRRADHVFCLNEEDRSELVHRLGRSDGSVTRIVPGADDVYAEAARGRDYRRATRILFAATWRKNKGVEDLVPAFATLAERYPDVSLHVVGGGLAEAAIRSRFPEPLCARIVVETPATDGEMAIAFAEADIFLLPSLFEGTPLTLIQAMMSGLPIVTTLTCGMKDVITDRETGLLVPIRSPGAIVTAVGTLLEDRLLRQQLGAAARAVACERYTWDRAARPVLCAYEALGGRLQ
jgi:glycosyltransferase involved in cell wall biosynthesis